MNHIDRDLRIKNIVQNTEVNGGELLDWWRVKINLLLPKMSRVTKGELAHVFFVLKQQGIISRRDVGGWVFYKPKIKKNKGR